MRGAALHRMEHELLAQGWPQFAFAYRLLEQSYRATAVRLRLLRLAVAFHLDDPLPSLRDPLGDTMLRVTIDGDEASFASAGGESRIARRP